MAEPNATRGPRSRPFTLIDGMILIALTAVSFWLFKEQGYFQDQDDVITYTIRRDVSRILDFLHIATDFMVPLTPSWLILRFRRPRPHRRRLGHQPGLVACVAATVAMSIAASANLTESFVHHHPTSIANIFWRCGKPCGYAVLGSWSASALFGPPRREPGWIDATGIGIGVAWIVVMLASFTLEYLAPFIQM